MPGPHDLELIPSESLLEELGIRFDVFAAIGLRTEGTDNFMHAVGPTMSVVGAIEFLKAKQLEELLFEEDCQEDEEDVDE